MKLTYFDDFAFAVQTKNGVFTINPSEKNDKILFSIFTSEDRDQSLHGNLLTWPGEYEFGGVAIQIFELEENQLGVKVVAEDVRIVFLSVLPREFSEKEKETIGTVDMLIPSIHTTDSWKKIIEEIDPKAVIPVGAQREKFLMEMGAANVQETAEFVFDDSSLPLEQTVFVKLSAS